MDLKKEKDMLQKMEYRAKKDLQNNQGYLAFSKSKGIMQFYRVVDGKREYLSKKKNRNVICKLAQERYAAKVLKVVEGLKKSLKTFLNEYDTEQLKSVYEEMPDGLKEYIETYTPSYGEYGEEWAHREYRRKSSPEDKRNITENGESVRSKSEVIIANKLKAMGLKYRYECAKTLKGFGVVYPDFTILDPESGEEVLLEHFGLMDDNAYLNTSFLGKLETYAENGIAPGRGLICTYETKERPLNTAYLDKVLSSYFNNQTKY